MKLLSAIIAICCVIPAWAGDGDNRYALTGAQHKRVLRNRILIVLDFHADPLNRIPTKEEVADNEMQNQSLEALVASLPKDQPILILEEGSDVILDRQPRLPNPNYARVHPQVQRAGWDNQFLLHFAGPFAKNQYKPPPGTAQPVWARGMDLLSMARSFMMADAIRDAHANNPDAIIIAIAGSFHGIDGVAQASLKKNKLSPVLVYGDESHKQHQDVYAQLLEDMGEAETKEFLNQADRAIYNAIQWGVHQSLDPHSKLEISELVQQHAVQWKDRQDDCFKLLKRLKKTDWKIPPR